jgi:hypothetical protein
MAAAPAPVVATRPPKQAIVRAGRYDQVTSVMIALITVFVVAVIFLSTMVITSPRIDVLKETVPVEFIEDPGGDPEGTVTDPTQAGSGGQEITDVTQTDIPADEVEKVPKEDSPVSISAEMADQLPQEPSFVTSNQSTSTNTGGGSGGTGTGNEKLAGFGKGKGGGFPREQRWFIRYADTASLDEYAKQLDYFGIELGAIMGKELVYISQMSGSTPQKRRAAGGGNEKRLYFTWQGGNRRSADVQLFRKAGVDVGDSTILQFYPKNTENLLAKVEFEYEKRKYNEIRRTYFGVRKPEKTTGYEFYVTRQVTIR